MTLVGIPEAEQAAVCALVAAVLHLGNVAFADARGGEASAVAPGAPQRHLAAAAELLGVDVAGLARALTTRTRHTVDGTPPLHVTWGCHLLGSGEHPGGRAAGRECRGAAA